LLGAGLCGGSAFRLLNGFFREVCAFIGEVSRDEMDGLMMDCAKRAYGKVEPARVTPLFRGTRRDPGLRGTIENLGMNNFTPASLVLGFYEGVCEEMRRAYDKFPKPAAAGGKLLLCGNAARKNALLLKIIEETFARRAHLSRYREEAAAGAALLAAAAFSSANTASYV
ncbi:MAG: FGGY-family carbohydrate kinase, partial [Bacillota bacterium]